jgi:hypothetical protein
MNIMRQPHIIVLLAGGFTLLCVAVYILVTTPIDELTETSVYVLAGILLFTLWLSRLFYRAPGPDSAPDTFIAELVRRTEAKDTHKRFSYTDAQGTVHGKFSRAEIIQLAKAGTVTMTTPLWDAGQSGTAGSSWRPAWEVLGIPRETSKFGVSSW